MSQTAAQMIAATRQHLLGGGLEQRNKLATPYTAGVSTTLSFTYPNTAIQAGVRLSIGLNTFYVWSVTADGVATVDGGHQGTVDANAAAGSVVLIRPEYTDGEIFRALNNDINELGGGVSGLYAVGTTVLTANAAVTAYDLPASAGQTIQSILEVSYRNTGSDPHWSQVPKEDLRLVRRASTTDFVDGLAVNILVAVQAGQPIRVTYASPFTPMTALTDDVETVTGLATSMLSIPPLGAAVSLLGGKEVRRNSQEAQGDSRRATEVPAGAISGSPRVLMGLRGQRIDAERVRLMQTYPYMVR